MTSSTDRIEASILLRASRARVWKALTDARQFGMWFGMRANKRFAPGAILRAVVKPTTVDEEVARHQEDCVGFEYDIFVERIEPEKLFSFRWHPQETDKHDPAMEPTTLVTFELTAGPEGVLVHVSETGFDHLPVERRAKAYAASQEGWSTAIQLLEKYLAQNDARPPAMYAARP